MRQLGDETLVKPAPGSGWPALRDALVHINWAYVRWLWDPAGASAIEPEQINSWDELEDYRRRVRGRFHEYLDSLSEAELTTPRDMNIDGELISHSPADILSLLLLTSASTTAISTRCCTRWASSRCKRPFASF